MRIIGSLLTGLLLALLPADVPPRMEFHHAIVRPSCAPTDAGALDIVMAAADNGCTEKEPFLRISIWKLPVVPGKPIELGGSSGTGIRCLRRDACEAAVSGTVVVEHYEQGKRASGHYELRFRDGSRESGDFDARWCDVRVLCG